MKKKSLDIIGPYPPPYGGISQHIYRIEQILKERKVDYTIYNHSFTSGPNVVATNKSVFWYITYLFRRKGSLVHFHHFFAFHYLYFSILSNFSSAKLMVTIHGEDILKYNVIYQRIIVLLLKSSRLQMLIVVSLKLSNYLSSKGVNNIWLPAYVPPGLNKVVQVNSVEGKKYFLYGIWKLERTIATKVYNVELAFELLKRIQSKYHMLFLIGSEAESDKVFLNQLIKMHQVEESVSVLYEKQLVDYLPNCEFLLRTNNEDGYGVSLQEALDLRVPAIASDVCIRPSGTILFKSGDINDLMDKVQNIDDYWNENSIETLSYHEELMNIYHKNL